MEIATPAEHAERLRRRRERRRRQVRRRRAAALTIVGGLVGAAAWGATHLLATQATAAAPPPVVLRPLRVAEHGPALPTLPDEIRGVHVTMALASVPGRLDEYLALRRDGLNTLELDVKDENGEVGFVAGAPALARADGAAKPYYDARRVVRRVHARGVYLIGRVVSFEDPVTATRHPELAIHRSDGSLWHTNGGLAWLNPYSRAAWRYDVDVAVAAARAGFDEIQFDYVRFPSDGDLSIIRYPGAHPQPMRGTIAAFLRYAYGRLHPLGVRVSADVFGLSATRDLGIGQYPGKVGRIADAIYPMVYPSHYNAGEYNLSDPNAEPETTVADSLRDFREKLAGGRALLVPWLQDFSLGRTYSPADVEAQIVAAREFHTGGFLLWNPLGVYTAEALRPGPPVELPPVAKPRL